MSLFNPVAPVLVLPACSSQGEKASTADEFVNDFALLKTTSGESRNNPDELHNTTKCINAELAEGSMSLLRTHTSLGR